MKKLKKYLEIAFFITINIIFASSSIALFCIMGICGILSLLLFNANPVYENDTPFVLFCLLFILLFLIFKIILFPVLYRFKKFFPYSHSFFDKIFATKRRTLIVFLTILLIQVVEAFCYIYIADANFEQAKVEALIFGFGLLPSYLIMFIYLKFLKKKEAS